MGIVGKNGRPIQHASLLSIFCRTYKYFKNGRRLEKLVQIFYFCCSVGDYIQLCADV